MAYQGLIADVRTLLESLGEESFSDAQISEALRQEAEFGADIPVGATAEERARNTDLITLPNDVEGTNCGNCKWFSGVDCAHDKVDQPVTSRQCCGLWDREGTKRSWQTTEAWNPSEHPRGGRPENPGEFSKGAGAGKGKADAPKGNIAGFHAVLRQKDGSYHSEHGEALPTDFHQRIKALRLPPAWSNVQISPDPKSALQAVGYDAKGRQQRVYSAEHSSKAAAEKFLRVKALVDELPAIDRKIHAALDGPDGPEKEAAAVLFLMRKTGFRIGSERDTKTEHEALGASTLTSKNVQIEGSKITFDFIGKKGVQIKQHIEDHELANVLRPRLARQGKLFDTQDTKVHDYLHFIDGVFKPKDLRTVVAAETALEAIATLPEPSNEKQFKQARAEVGKRVAAKLGNTPTVALASYIPPEVFGPWQTKISFKNG